MTMTATRRIFQSTLSQGERPSTGSAATGSPRYFNPRSRKESDAPGEVKVSHLSNISIHALARRATFLLINSICSAAYFNPRSRKESDFVPFRLLWQHWRISIHALARRATGKKFFAVEVYSISIHALARRATNHSW